MQAQEEKDEEEISSDHSFHPRPLFWAQGPPQQQPPECWPLPPPQPPEPPPQQLEPPEGWLQQSELWGLWRWDLWRLWWLRQQPPPPELQQPPELEPQQPPELTLQQEDTGGHLGGLFGGHLGAGHLGGHLGVHLGGGWHCCWLCWQDISAVFRSWGRVRQQSPLPSKALRSLPSCPGLGIPLWKPLLLFPVDTYRGLRGAVPSVEYDLEMGWERIPTTTWYRILLEVVSYIAAWAGVQWYDFSSLQPLPPKFKVLLCCPRLERSGAISAHFNLCLPSSSDSPASGS
ncbi:putative uncharacterized protein CCDC28A-AS1 [Plecturocebus cupreus]